MRQPIAMLYTLKFKSCILPIKSTSCTEGYGALMHHHMTTHKSYTDSHMTAEPIQPRTMHHI